MADMPQRGQGGKFLPRVVQKDVIFGDQDHGAPSETPDADFLHGGNSLNLDMDKNLDDPDENQHDDGQRFTLGEKIAGSFEGLREEPVKPVRPKAAARQPTSNGNKELKEYMLRHEELDKQAVAIREDRKELMTEMKERGFDLPTFRRVMKEKRLTAAVRRMQEEKVEAYRVMLGLD